MKAGEAKRVAGQWVAEVSSRLPGYCGSWLSGSVARMADEAEVPVSSDVDVMIALAGNEVPPKPGKFLFNGVLLEATYIPFSMIAKPESVLGSYHLAGGFATDARLDDPSGHLGELVAVVSQAFANPEWVARRLAEARGRSESGLLAVLEARERPLGEAVLGWLFPTGVMAHVLLVAALRNPTIRLRYLAVREMLVEYGLGHRYEDLLACTGYADWTQARTMKHMKGLARVFDAACAVDGTPFPFRTDISRFGRPIAIDGCDALIRAGNHREAVFWMVATYARCHVILEADGAPEMKRLMLHAFEALLGDLEAGTVAQRAEKARLALEWFPELDGLADEILLRSGGITGRK